jgi:hypothetical protein
MIVAGWAVSARLIKQFLPLKKAIKLIVYEAGPTGYGLAPRISKCGQTTHEGPPCKLDSLLHGNDRRGLNNGGCYHPPCHSTIQK